MTALDDAHSAMMAADGDETAPDAARLRYFAALADAELVVLLDHVAEGGAEITPRLFDLEDGPVVLAYDGEDRLAVAAGGPAAYAALPGRAVARQLAGRGIGLGLNLGAGSAEFLLDPAAVDWLARVLDHGPVAAEARPETFTSPKALPGALLSALDAKLARAAGLARAVLIAGVRYGDGRQGHMLAFLDAVPAAESALARAAAEALTFSGIEAGEIDVTFLAGTDPAALAMAKAALRIDLPEAPAADSRAATAPRAPGSDPDKPPILR
ncbi:SseB family protein [Szabonella alba]|uniref:SseB family protein n=1 Tax=Szabonella alba TaxID=2804194 RepID=A0A8K0V8J7_9RHOB|nr:SseB family protein [Szabonella alba]MBL4917111.1 SseB family protein [Szabonella alba]